jgi:hypothetical protein
VLELSAREFILDFMYFFPRRLHQTVSDDLVNNLTLSKRAYDLGVSPFIQVHNMGKI